MMLDNRPCRLGDPDPLGLPQAVLSTLGGPLTQQPALRPSRCDIGDGTRLRKLSGVAREARHPPAWRQLMIATATTIDSTSPAADRKACEPRPGSAQVERPPDRCRADLVGQNGGHVPTALPSLAGTVQSLGGLPTDAVPQR